MLKNLTSPVARIKGGIYLFIALIMPSLSCTQEMQKDNPDDTKAKLDNYLQNAMDLYNIPGLALAVTENGEVSYKIYLGKASLEADIPVEKKTLFRVFSTTKLITSVALFQLIQDGKLSLDDPISTYLDDIPPQWRPVQIKNLLSHSSGLPDFIRYESSLSDKDLMERLSKEKMEFVTGEQFRYNQTNYWLIAQIIEAVSGRPFEEYVLQNQFNNSEKGILFSSNASDTIPNRATRYFYNGRSETFEIDKNNNGRRGHPGNGLNITLDKFIEWNRLLDSNELINQETKSKMWSPFAFRNGKDEFLHGWGTYLVNGINSYGFSGGNLSAFRKFTEQHTTIILLSNGYELPAYDIIVNDVARIIIPEIKEHKVTLESEIVESVLDNQFDKALVSFQKAKDENPGSSLDNVKWNINSIGNSFLYIEENKEKALQVFKFNVEANENWWISMASLAEMYQLQQDTLKAISTYQKAISLNESNEWNYNEKMKTEIEKLATN